MRPLFWSNLDSAEQEGWRSVHHCGWFTLRRFEAKVASRAVWERKGLFLAPLQLGFGTSMGAEAAAHAARTYLHHLPLNHTLVKLDFKNAFNTIRRDKMLEAARESRPELFPYVFSCLLLTFYPFPPKDHPVIG